MPIFIDNECWRTLIVILYQSNFIKRHFFLTNVVFSHSRWHIKADHVHARTYTYIHVHARTCTYMHAYAFLYQLLLIFVKTNRSRTCTFIFQLFLCLDKCLRSNLHENFLDWSRLCTLYIQFCSLSNCEIFTSVSIVFVY